MVMKTSMFNRYNRIKESLNSESYKSIQLDKLAAFFIADMVYNFLPKNIFSKLLMLIKYLFFIPNVKVPSENLQAIFGWSLGRQDYKRLSEAYKKQLGWQFYDICLGGKICGRKIRFDLLALLFSVKKSLTINNINLADRLVILFSVYASVSFLRFLKKRFKGVIPEYYLSFNSSFEYESVFTLYLKEKGVKTFSMQHGMYFEFKNPPPYDMISSYFCTAEYFLLWGEFTREQIINYTPNDTSLVVFGNPLYRLDKIDKLNSCSPESKLILVCLPRCPYQKESIRLLNVLAKPCFSEYKFVIRPHPNLNKKVINEFVGLNNNFTLSSNNTLREDMLANKYKAMIGFNSSVLFESLFYSIPVVQYVSGNDEFYNVGFAEFSTKEELLLRLKELSVITIDDIDYYFLLEHGDHI